MKESGLFVRSMKSNLDNNAMFKKWSFNIFHYLHFQCFLFDIFTKCNDNNFPINVTQMGTRCGWTWTDIVRPFERMGIPTEMKVDRYKNNSENTLGCGLSRRQAFYWVYEGVDFHAGRLSIERVRFVKYVGAKRRISYSRVFSKLKFIT